MFSDKLRKALLLLLRQGLWGTREDASCLFPLSPAEWQGLYALAKKQTVEGIVYDGINLLDISLYPPRPLLIQWTADIDFLERLNRTQNEVLKALRRQLDGKSAPAFKLLKGQGVAAFYRNPLRRVCGDIDLWFDGVGAMRQADLHLKSLGVDVREGGNEDAGYLLNGVVIEHHSRLIELHSPLLKRKIEDWERKVFAGSADVPSPVANHLLLSTHILKHLINEGIGLRQLCDVTMVLHALNGQTDGEELKRLCRRWHIFKWTRLLYALSVKYLGMPEASLPFPTRGNPDALMNEIWESGNFGHQDHRYGRRPEGKWQSKRHTWRIVSHKFHLSLRYAAPETLWWLYGLGKARLVELFKKGGDK